MGNIYCTKLTLLAVTFNSFAPDKQLDMAVNIFDCLEKGVSASRLYFRSANFEKGQSQPSKCSLKGKGIHSLKKFYEIYKSFFRAKISTINLKYLRKK